MAPASRRMLLRSDARSSAVSGRRAAPPPQLGQRPSAPRSTGSATMPGAGAARARPRSSCAKASETQGKVSASDRSRSSTVRNASAEEICPAAQALRVAATISVYSAMRWSIWSVSALSPPASPSHMARPTSRQSSWQSA